MLVRRGGNASAVSFAFLMWFAIAAFGCTTTPQNDGDPIGAVPHDFSVDVAILLGRGVEESPEAHRRPVRMILYPDGSLHSGTHPRRGSVNFVPGLTRRLNRNQMAEIYALARELNLSDPERSDGVTNPALIETGREEIVHQLAITANNQHWMFIRRQRADEEPDAAVTRFIRHLAALAWETDVAEAEPVVIPHRYNFGPDPYARYR